MDRTEELVIELLRAGNEKAYKYLYDNHYQILCHVANQYVCDEFLAETIVSDVIFHLWEVRDRLDITTTLRSYLFTCVRNRCLDYIKSQKSKREETFTKKGIADLPVVRYIEDDDYPLGHLLRKEFENHMAEAISRLPSECQRIFRLSRFEGKNYEDISKELGISVNTVKYHIKNALKILRMDLRQYLAEVFVIFIQNYIS